MTQALTPTTSDCDFLTGSGREPAVCELRCSHCGDGMRYDQRQCATCGDVNPRYVETVIRRSEAPGDFMAVRR